MTSTLFKPTVTALGGLFSTVLKDVTPMFILTGAFIVADIYTARRLQKRLAVNGKISAENARLTSSRITRVFFTLARIMALLVLTAMADYLILAPLGIPAIKFVAGGICFWQALSLLENEAAENNAPWATYARRFLIDKAKRYLSK